MERAKHLFIVETLDYGGNITEGIYDNLPGAIERGKEVTAKNEYGNGCTVSCVELNKPCYQTPTILVAIDFVKGEVIASYHFGGSQTEGEREKQLAFILSQLPEDRQPFF